MITQVFTFGYGHSCPFTGRALADHYATVVAADKEQCRALMVQMFGLKWAFQYDSAELARPPDYPRRLVEHIRMEVTARGPAASPDGGERS